MERAEGDQVVRDAKAEPPAARQAALELAYLVAEVARPVRRPAVAQRHERTRAGGKTPSGSVGAAGEVVEDHDVPAFEGPQRRPRRVRGRPDGAELVGRTVPDQAQHPRRAPCRLVERDERGRLAAILAASDDAERTTAAERLPPGATPLIAREDVVAPLGERPPDVLELVEPADVEHLATHAHILAPRCGRRQ